MANNLIATASISVDATRQKVWNALTDPAAIKRYMFGSDVTSDWKVGGTPSDCSRERRSPVR